MAVKALDWLIAERKQAVVSVEKLTGQTACSQLITLQNGERYILRLQNTRAKQFGIDYRQEAQLLEQIAFLNFTPKPLYYDERASILSWIEGEVPTHFSTELLHQLAQNLVELHQFDLQAVSSNSISTQVPLHCSTKPFNLSKHCTMLWEKLSLKGELIEKHNTLPFSPPFPEIQPLARAICHHDLHLGNFIEKENSLFIIDWEYATVSDPALDLALFLQGNSLSSQEKMIFFKSYFAKSSLDPTACQFKIAEYQPLVAILSQLWYALSALN